MHKCRTTLIMSPVIALVMMMIACLPLSAAADQAEKVDLNMVMYFGGFTAGKMKLSVDFNDDDAISSLRLKSKGVLEMMTGYKGRSEARTALSAEAWPMPARYDSSYETSNYTRRIEIGYNEEDGEITHLQTWKRGKPRRNKLSEDLLQATIDPLTTILQLRHWILALRDDPTTAEEQAFEVFDGRRRYRLDASVIQRDKVKFDGKRMPAYRLKVVMDPIAGFSSKDMLANWAAEDGDRWIELVVTDDDNPLPLWLETNGGTVGTSIVLQRACVGGERCTDYDS